MNTLKIYKAEWILPIIYQARQVVVHLNPHKGTKLIGNKWLYCVTLYTDKTPAIIRLSNLKQAKQCARAFDEYLTINSIMADDVNSANLEQLLKFRDFITNFTVEHNIKCFIKR